MVYNIIMEKINYFTLFLKAIIFALIVLALKTFFNGIARADEFNEILNMGYNPPPQYDYTPQLHPQNYNNNNNNNNGYDFNNASQPIPVYELPTGLNNTVLVHPVENPYTVPSPAYKINH